MRIFQQWWTISLFWSVRTALAQDEKARITGIVYINADTDASFTPLQADVLEYREIGTKNVTVMVTANAATESVFMTLDRPARSFCERAAPFAIFPNTKAGNFRGRKIKFGSRVLTAVPFSGPNCRTGTEGALFTHKFSVIRPPRVSTPTAPPTYEPTASPTRDPTVAPTRPRIEPFSVQPRVTTVESLPARKVAGVIDLPNGSPWCDGNPTYWLPGHKADNDTPNCFENGAWTRPFTAQLDDNDILNDIDGPEVIDRHDCGTLDANNDGELDLYCLVGADKGSGEGYNELYLTQPDGSVQKVLRNGLQKHNGMRGRFTTVLNGANGAQFVFIATKGVPRTDGKSNAHRMYRKTGVAPDYFEEEIGPWIQHTNASCSYTVDVNNDGKDDLIVGNLQDHSLLFVTTATGWTQELWNFTDRTKNWRKVRVADFDGDGIDDLLVAHFGFSGYMRIFRGMSQPPYFHFDRQYYATTFPNGIPDLEVLDVNGDGINDIYVVQSEERPRRSADGIEEVTYCAGKFNHRDWWAKENQPPSEFVPPIDAASDFLLLGKGNVPIASQRFERITMQHSEPGCGNLVRPFGDKALLLAQGDFVRPGHNLVLNWN